MDRYRAMELFQSVSGTLSFSETGRLHGISATAVSRLVTELEEHLGVKLLVRSTRALVLTEAGRAYAADVQQILWSIRQADETVASLNQSPRGVLRVHARTMFGQRVLPTLMAKFRLLHPEIVIELTLSESKVDLVRDRFDIDFRISPPAEAGVRRRRLFRSERFLVASPRYLAAVDAPQTPADLARHQCLVYHLPGRENEWRFWKNGHPSVRHIVPRHVANNGNVLLDLALLGEGIALLDDYTVHPDLQAGRLQRVLSEYTVTNTTLDEGMYATIVDTAILPAKIKLFLDFVTGHMADKRRFRALS